MALKKIYIVGDVTSCVTGKLLPTNLLELLDPEDVETAVLLNMNNYVPVNKG